MSEEQKQLITECNGFRVGILVKNIGLTAEVHGQLAGEEACTHIWVVGFPVPFKVSESWEAVQRKLRELGVRGGEDDEAAMCEAVFQGVEGL